MTARKIARQTKPDMSRNDEELDKFILRQRMKEASLIPIRLNKTTIVLRPKK